MSAPFRFPKFFVTNPSPCPYLPGKVERKVFTELNGRNAGELNEALGRIGFRRSQSVAYRPSCFDCSACVSVRVLAQEFKPNGTQRKLMRRPADLEVAACRPWTTEEQYDAAPPLSRPAPSGISLTLALERETHRQQQVHARRASLPAVVTMVMSMPRGWSMLS